MYPDPNVGPLWEIPVPYIYILGIYGWNNPQESLENTINTMGTRLGVHPIVPWIIYEHHNQVILSSHVILP